MLRQLLSQTSLTLWPIVSLVLFLIVFTTILVWTYRRGSRKHYDHMADLVHADGTSQKREGKNG